MIFGDFQNGAYQAVEDFRVIPLGREFWPGAISNAIAGKSPDEQLQILFKRSLDNLNRQMKLDAEARQRLETFLKK